MGNPSEGNGSDQGRASFTTGSTTQGGSNYGQGSSQLGGSVYEQGDAANAGSNYENEADRFGDTGTQADGHKPAGGTEAKVGYAAHTGSGSQRGTTADGNEKQSGGGASGYDVKREQEQVNQEREDMHSERDLGELNVERTDPNTNPEVTPNPGKENPGTAPGTGQTTIGDF